jgi:polysaccharide biosynthesis acetyltransferase WcbI-like protein
MVSDLMPVTLDAADPAGREVEAGIRADSPLLDQLERGKAALRGPKGSVRVRRRAAPGCVLYGPFWRLAAGNYRLTLWARASRPRPAAQPVLGIEVVAANRFQQAWRDLTAEELAESPASIDFAVPPELSLESGEEARFEFRCFHLGHADLTIFALDLARLDENRSEPAAPRRWRLTGRLAIGAIAHRRGGEIRVPRAAPAGWFVGEGRPFLQLPAGHYRLSFRCRTGPPLLPAQPVLAVEVLARSRWRRSRPPGWRSLLPGATGGGEQQAWRDFTVAELGDGAGILDFAVPARLSVEGGEDVVFAFRFCHLGNAALAIGEVDLYRDDGSPHVTTPRLWRLLGRLGGRRRGDEIALPTRTGRTLSLRRPRLRLPPGRYRLRLGGHAANPGKPAVAIEIAARGRPQPDRLLLRESTAAELAVSCQLEFAVPQGPAGDSEIELRLIALGRGAARITTLELREERGAGGAAMPLPAVGLRPAGMRRLVVVGNCQAESVYQALSRAPALNRHFAAKYHFVHLQANLHDAARHDLAECQVMLVQEIHDWEDYPLREHIRDDTEIVKFPLLRFISLWPFDHYNGPGDREAYEREWPNLTFAYQDGLLGRLRREIPDPEARFAAYRALAVDGLIDLERLHRFETRRLAAMDEEFGCAIGRTILDNFRKRQVFYTTNHPNGRILAMLVDHLLERLGVGERYQPRPGLATMRRSQVPVHPLVAKRLGVEWADERTRYLYGGERITWETYIRRYIAHYG